MPLTTYKAYINQKYDEVLTGGCIGELDIFAADLKYSVFTASTSMSGGRHVKRKTNKRKQRVYKNK